MVWKASLALSTKRVQTLCHRTRPARHKKGAHSYHGEFAVKTLWESFRNLSKARNSFVHEGVAKIDGAVVTEIEARRLVGKADEILAFVKLNLPPDLQWPEYERVSGSGGRYDLFIGPAFFDYLLA